MNSTPIKITEIGAFLNLFSVIAKNPRQTNLKNTKRRICIFLPPCVDGTKKTVLKIRMRKTKSKNVKKKI